MLPTVTNQVLSKLALGISAQRARLLQATLSDALLNNMDFVMPPPSSGDVSLTEQSHFARIIGMQTTMNHPRAAYRTTALVAADDNDNDIASIVEEYFRLGGRDQRFAAFLLYGGSRMNR